MDPTLGFWLWNLRNSYITLIFLDNAQVENESGKLVLYVVLSSCNQGIIAVKQRLNGETGVSIGSCSIVARLSLYQRATQIHVTKRIPLLLGFDWLKRKLKNKNKNWAK